MNSSQLLELIKQGKTKTIELKSWVKTPDFKKFIKLCVKEVLLFSS